MSCSKTISANIPSHGQCLPIDRARMKRTAQDLLAILDGYLPAGCREWARATRPEIGSLLGQAASELLEASAAADQGRFAMAVQRCAERYQKAASIYGNAMKLAQKLTYSSESFEMVG